MFNHLNVNSREIIVSLCKGGMAKIGESNVGAISEESKSLLALLSMNINTLRELRGKELVGKVISLSSRFDFTDVERVINNSEEMDTEGNATKLRLGRVRACSFRGLAPADIEWEYDFKGKSHLMHGPNGCGKSSLLGAICWCLAGSLFRDDCPPCKPEKVTAYPIEGGSEERVDRDDAQALVDEHGNTSSAVKPYWVELQFLVETDEDEDNTLYLKRSSADGLSGSNDGVNWSSFESVAQAGIDELDCELRLLMPAKATHMQFGKNPDLIRLLAEVAGYGDLETVTEVAESLTTNSRRNVTTIKNTELMPEEQRIQESVNQIQESATERIKQLSSYQDLCKEGRTKDDIRVFGEAINGEIVAAKAQLANDLGLGIPDKDATDYKEWQEKSNDLPGQISNLLLVLEKSLNEIFSTSLGLEAPSADDIKNIEDELTIFEESAKASIEERLQWARREAEQEKLGLMLKAAGHFVEDLDACPVCTQSLQEVPHIREELKELHELSLKEHLQKKVDDFARSLKAELDAVVPPSQREWGSKSFAQRIVGDWASFKETHCKGLLLSVAEGIDGSIKSAVKDIEQGVVTPFELPSEAEAQFADTFSSFAKEIDNAKIFISLCRCMSLFKDTVSEELQALLMRSEEGSEVAAFKEVLERAKGNNEILKSLIVIQGYTRELWKSTRGVEEITSRINVLTVLADSAESIKSLKDTIRNEVKAMVKGELGQKTEQYYNSLYDNEVLEFAQLTTGHAANPDVKGEVNLYLKAGNHQVPMGPFSNAGRMRALLLSFAFALLEKSSDSLNFIILDDPALSLDDEHKARFVDNLVKPCVERGQVILGTHYERFFQDSEPVFIDGVKLRMIPRQRAADRVGFEAGDLLRRVAIATQSNSGQWREVAGNIRVWIERTLGTLSGYCPQPFVVFDNIPQSISNYSAITDPVIATPDRDTIVQTLNCAHIERILHKLHHNEAVNKPDVKDASDALQQCTKVVKREIKRLKGLYNHALLNRCRGSSTPVILEISGFKRDRVRKDLLVVREAAAAHNGEGIEWNVTDEYPVDSCPVVQVCADVVAPVALSGQYLLLDWEDREPANGDLVVVESPDKKKYVRRMWREEDGTVMLVGANPTMPYEPVRVMSGKCSIRRIVGVLYDQSPITTSDDEWSMRGVNDSWFDDILGVRVKGTSLEPVARDGQIVLIKKVDVRSRLSDDMLACFSVKEVGEVIKRCYVCDSHCILCAVNPNEREVPIVVGLDSLQQAYELKGVLFEVGPGQSRE